MMRSIYFLLAVFIVVVGIDQFSKWDAQAHLIAWENPEDIDEYLGARHEVWVWGDRGNIEESFFRLQMKYSRNKGAAFSFLNNSPDWFRIPFFYAMTLLAIVFVGYFFKSSSREQILFRYALIMILAGAIGNVLDRLQYGYVVDFVDTAWRIGGWQHDFAIFNVADMAINCGLGCLVVDAIKNREQNKRLHKS